MVTGIADKGGTLILLAKLLLVLRASLYASSACSLALAFSPEASGAALGNSGTGKTMGTVISL